MRNGVVVFVVAAVVMGTGNVSNGLCISINGKSFDLPLCTLGE